MTAIQTEEFNPALMSNPRRDSVRNELSEMYVRMPADGLSATVSGQVLETAINGIDAVARIQELADKLAPLDGESPLGSIGFVIAEQIRNALRGI